MRDGEGAAVTADLDQRTARMAQSAVLSITAEGKLLHRLQGAIEGKYQLLGALGQGGMGAVYLAQDLALERPVAIKVMLPDHAPGSDTVERFRREARTVASLHHPNIVPVYDVHESADLAYFVMRYVKGRTLESILHRRGPIPLEVARSILRQVGSGLEYAHRAGVIHRDIKPANIMIDEDGWALITDFGIAKVRGAHELTRTGTTIGTPSYMSPEQCSDLEITSASDQYALGIVAYELLTGRPPFRGSTVAAVVKKHLFDAPPPLDELVPECPRESARAIGRMLAKSPALRWSSVEEAVRQIGGRLDADSEVSRKQIAAVAEHGEEVAVTWLDPDTLTPVTAPADATIRHDPPRRHRPLWLPRVGGGVLGTAALVLVTVALQGNPLDGTSAEDPMSAAAQMPSQRSGGVPTTKPPVGLPDPSEDNPAASGADPTRATGPAQTEAVRDSQPPLASPPGTPGGPQMAGRSFAPERGADALSPAPVEAALTGEGSVLLGTRGRPAVLYANGAAQGAASRLLSWTLPAGDVTLSLRMEGCTPWDTTVFVRPDEQVRIGYRSPACAG